MTATETISEASLTASIDELTEAATRYADRARERPGAWDAADAEDLGELASMALDVARGCEQHGLTDAASRLRSMAADIAGLAAERRAVPPRTEVSAAQPGLAAHGPTPPTRSTV